MATVRELSDPYTHLLVNPLPPGSDDVCSVCTTFTEGYETCYPCGHHPQHAGAVLPISYSVHFGQLHTHLARYKRSRGRTALRLQNQLAAVLWRFLDEHEGCLATAVSTEHFDVVTTVPSGSTERDPGHPLARIAGQLVRPTRDRYERLLRRSDAAVPDRTVDLGRFAPCRELAGEAVLLIDDTWTTGASVQSAAGSLLNAGAGAVGVVVIGRHINEDYGSNAERLNRLPKQFDWSTCALCAER